MQRAAIFGVALFAAAQVSGISAADVVGPASERLGVALTGRGLTDFALSKEEKKFSLEDKTGGPSGTFKIAGGFIQVAWRDDVSGVVEIRDESELCAVGTAPQEARCFTMFTPVNSGDVCAFYVVDVIFNRVGCLRPSE